MKLFLDICSVFNVYLFLFHISKQFSKISYQQANFRNKFSSFGLFHKVYCQQIITYLVTTEFYVLLKFYASRTDARRMAIRHFVVIESRNAVNSNELFFCDLNVSVKRFVNPQVFGDFRTGSRNPLLKFDGFTGTRGTRAVQVPAEADLRN